MQYLKVLFMFFLLVFLTVSLSCSEKDNNPDLTVYSQHGLPSPSGTTEYAKGDEITIRVTSPDDNSSGTRYICTGWTGTGSIPEQGSTNSLNFTINTDSTITWNWKTEYLLTLSSNNSIRGTVSPEGESWYDANEEVTLIAIANTRYEFTGWSGDSTSTDNPLTIQMDSAKTITGMFSSEIYNSGLLSFTDVSGQAGLSGISGGRVAWGDFNNDGYEDLLVSGCILLLNSAEGIFTNVTQNVGLPSGSAGGLWGDYDNDGYPDIFAYRHWDPNRLFKNEDGVSLTEVTIPAFENCQYPSEAAVWVDIDADSYLDIYIANYEVDLSEPTPDFLFHNENGADFSDWTQAAGITPETDMCGRGVNCGDFDNDGDVDIFVSNYRLNPDFLWVNDGAGHFTDKAAEKGVAGDPDTSGYYGHTIGSAFGDYDNDGDLDLLCGSLAHPGFIQFSDITKLYRNNGQSGNYRFVDVTSMSGIQYEETHSSVAWADFDNDGYLDFYITSIYEGRMSFLYRNNRNGTFTDVTGITGTAVDGGWGCAWADYDNDGDLDLVTSSSSGIHLFKNNCDARNWVKVELEGVTTNKLAFGTRVKVERLPGGHPQIREVDGGSGTGCQNSRVLHFGLGNYSGNVKVEISWLGGDVEVIDSLSVNTCSKITQSAE
ncbi:MAG: FG-GAP-like repeat-containing protein [Planctomycetota bacterium]